MAWLSSLLDRAMWKKRKAIAWPRSWPTPSWLVIVGIPSMVARVAFAITFLLFIAIVAPPAYFQYVIALPASESGVKPPQWVLTLLLLAGLGFVGSAIAGAVAVAAFLATMPVMAVVVGAVATLKAAVRRFRRRPE